MRVHTGSESAEAASSVGARAYTVGNDIHFAAGQYAPADPFGLHLLAHEVAHTQQQAGGSPHRQNKLEVSSAGDAAELDADRAADAMVIGAPTSVGFGSGIQREEAKESNVEKGGDYQVYGTAGENTYTAKIDKDGHLSSFGKDMELWSKTFGPWPICGTPPLFASITCGAKAGGALGKDKKPGETFTTNITGEITGSILMGAAKEGLGKAGIEGSITGSLAGEGKARVTDSGFEVESIEIPLKCEVTVALVGEVGEGHHKVGGGIKRNLGALKIGTVKWDGKQVTFDHCSIEEVGQFAKEVLKNSLDTIADTSPAALAVKKAKQAYDDHKANEEFEKNTDAQTKEGEAMMHADGGDFQGVRDRSVYNDASAVREEDAHPKLRQKITDAKAKADAACVPFTGKDPSWFKNGAWNVAQAGTTSRMQGNQLSAKFEACDGGNELWDLANQAEAAYLDAEKQFKAAQKLQFGG